LEFTIRQRLIGAPELVACALANKDQFHVSIRGIITSGLPEGAPWQYLQSNKRPTIPQGSSASISTPFLISQIWRGKQPSADSISVAATLFETPLRSAPAILPCESAEGLERKLEAHKQQAFAGNTRTRRTRIHTCKIPHTRASGF
jgi:hypothetical protein